MPPILLPAVKKLESDVLHSWYTTFCLGDISCSTVRRYTGSVIGLSTPDTALLMRPGKFGAGIRGSKAEDTALNLVTGI
jgi:hypothetical protein